MDGGATAEKRTEPKTKQEADKTTTDTSDATNFLSDFKTKVLEEERERLRKEIKIQHTIQQWMGEESKHPSTMTQQELTQKERRRHTSDNSTASTEVTAPEPDDMETLEEEEEILNYGDMQQEDMSDISYTTPPSQAPSTGRASITGAGSQTGNSAAGYNNIYPSLQSVQGSICGGSNAGSQYQMQGGSQCGSMTGASGVSNLTQGSVNSGASGGSGASLGAKSKLSMGSSLQSYNTSLSSSGIGSDVGSNATQTTRLTGSSGQTTNSKLSATPSRLTRSQSMRIQNSPGLRFNSAASSVSQQWIPDSDGAGSRSTASGLSNINDYVVVELPNGQVEYFMNNNNGQMRQLTRQEAEELGLGNSAGGRGDVVDNNSQISDPTSEPPPPSNSQAQNNNHDFVMVDPAIQQPGNLHTYPDRRMANQQRQDTINQYINTIAPQGGGGRKAIEHAVGDPLFNCVGDWLQRTSEGRMINMGQWRPGRNTDGKFQPVGLGKLPDVNINNKLSINAALINQKKTYQDKRPLPPPPGLRGA